MPAWNVEVGVMLIVAGVAVLLGVFLFARPKKPKQGIRQAWEEEDQDAERVEPSLSEQFAEFDDDLPSMSAHDDETMDDALESNSQGDFFVSDDDDVGDASEHDGSEGDVDDEADASDIDAPKPSQGSVFDHEFEKIITLFISARAGEMFQGSDLLVACEKVGLVLGDMNIFHRFGDQDGDVRPVFSVANILKPGSFDINGMADSETPGLTVFMMLPGPLSALDAWEIMLPITERLSELLDGMVLDAQRNALGRQRIAYLRDELRAWDRAQAKKDRPRTTRW